MALDPPGHVAICFRDAGNDLVSAECEQLTGCKPDESGRAFGHALDQIPRAAYLRYGARCIVETGTLDALIEWIREARFQATGFRLELIDLCAEGLASKRRVTVAVADAIDGRPNLDHPQQKLLLMSSDQSCWFGEIVVEAARAYLRQEAKPYHTSGALHPRLARALVNLVPRTASSILDPCCGTGSILLEACAVGLDAYGADKNPRMVGMSRKNLAHFDYAAPVELIDARDWTQTADALIADLPYGRDRALNEAVILELLRTAATLAPVAILIAGKDISSWLRKVGFRDIELFRVMKTRGFTRYIHRARSADRSRRFAEPPRARSGSAG